MSLTIWLLFNITGEKNTFLLEDVWFLTKENILISYV